MPYIKEEDKIALKYGRSAKTSGELNYQITEVILKYLDTHGLSYSTINDIVGALEGAKLEFYRRVGEPYENLKKFENGDVYPNLVNLLPPKESEGGG